ncbi:quinone-oxidoreductase QR1, chloroplastic-like isoform X1 [Musa acuminata AAA Group]|uniref:quinone-oxidoreductase QR1, chloroplastic-like isoform X1 n=2 Tax=Musa acuminata AAA Group TaxID=214697 RepID=UPI0031D35CB1
MAARTMRAVQYGGYGGGAAALQHVEIQVPSPKKDEVLLRVEAASMNPADWKVQKGAFRPFLPSKFPFVPVSDVAGEVVEVGPGVDGFKPGDKVVTWLGFKAGGLAEYAVAPVNLTVHIPPEVSAADAAGLPIAGFTALQALRYATTKFDGTGDPANVLITAASGGVGTFAVQIAKLGNLHVTATCGARNMELVRSLGADEVLDYKTPEGKSLKSPSGRKYDVVVNCTTSVGWSSLESNLAAHGKVVDLNPSPGAFLRSALKQLTCSNKKLVVLFATATKEDLQFLVELVKGGKLRTVIDSRYALGKAEEAWAKSMEGHASGKIIVECDQVMDI